MHKYLHHITISSTLIFIASIFIIISFPVLSYSEDQSAIHLKPKIFTDKSNKSDKSNYSNSDFIDIIDDILHPASDEPDKALSDRVDDLIEDLERVVSDTTDDSISKEEIETKQDIKSNLEELDKAIETDSVSDEESTSKSEPENVKKAQKKEPVADKPLQKNRAVKKSAKDSSNKKAVKTIPEKTSKKVIKSKKAPEAKVDSKSAEIPTEKKNKNIDPKTNAVKDTDKNTLSKSIEQNINTQETGIQSKSDESYTQKKDNRFNEIDSLLSDLDRKISDVSEHPVYTSDKPENKEKIKSGINKTEVKSDIVIKKDTESTDKNRSKKTQNKTAKSTHKKPKVEKKTKINESISNSTEKTALEHSVEKTVRNTESPVEENSTTQKAVSKFNPLQTVAQENDNIEIQKSNNDFEEIDWLLMDLDKKISDVEESGNTINQLNKEISVPESSFQPQDDMNIDKEDSQINTEPKAINSKPAKILSKKKNISEAEIESVEKKTDNPVSESNTIITSDNANDKESSIVINDSNIEKEKTKTNKEKKHEFSISGFRYYKIRNYDSSGNSEEFKARSGLLSYGQKIEQGTNLSLKAEIGDKTSISGTFSEMPRQERDMKFRLEHSHYGATYGDFTAQLEGGVYAGFSKKIEGIQFDYNTSKTKISSFVSKSKSQTKTISFTGRNIKGPYDLNVRDILSGGSIVKLNNEVLSEDQYTIDSFQGTIIFTEILDPSDTVIITYEKRLVGSLNAGNFFGLSASRISDNDKFEYGFTHLVQKANRQAQKIIESVIEETPTVNGNVISVQNLFIYRNSLDREQNLGSETITKNDVVLIANVDYNLTGNEYGSVFSKEEIDRFYANGQFRLKTAAEPGDVFKVSYSYYPQVSVIKETVNEELVLINEGSIGLPSETTIYSGSEEIYICDDPELTNCSLIPLVPSQDYTINETLNQIEFTPPLNTVTQFAKITYWYYPEITSLESEYDHVVNDYRLKYSPDDKLSFNYEYAVSEADVSSRPIQVLNEILGTIDNDIDCSLQANSNSCTFNLLHSDISPRTVLLYFDDRLSDEASKTYGSDFTVDNNTGEIKINIFIPAGTQLITDYQYNPSIPSGLSQGARNMFSGEYKGAKTQLTFNLKSGDTDFTPIGGESNLETKRLSYHLNQKISDNLKFTADWIDIDNATDIFELNKKESNQQRYSIKGAFGIFDSFGIDYEKRENTDDYSPTQSDTKDTKLGINFSMPVPALKNADISVGYVKSDYDDLLDENTNRKTIARKLGFNYKPTRKLMLTSMFTINEIESNSSSLSFSTKNAMSKVGVKWLAPRPIMTVAADFDVQSTSDSRESVADREIQRSRFVITTIPFGKMKSVNLSFTQQDTPSITGPSSGSKNKTVSTGFMLTSAINFNPSYSISNSYVGDTSSTENVSKNYMLEYRPPGNPFRASLNFINNEVDTNSSGSITSSTNDNWNITLGYDPSPIWAYTFNYSKASYSSSNSSEYDTTTMKTRISRKPNEKANQWFIFQQTSRSGTVDETNRLFELGTKNQLSELISLNMFYRLSNYSTVLNPEYDYTGHLIETTLQADF